MPYVIMRNKKETTKDIIATDNVLWSLRFSRQFINLVLVYHNVITVSMFI